MISRVKKIFSEVEGDVDLIVLMNAVAPHIDIGFYYVTGLTSGIFEGCAALLRPGRMEILSSRLEEESAKSAQAKATIFGTGLERDGILKRRLKGAKRIGVNSVELTHKNFTILKRLAKGSRFVDVSEAITNARIVKDDGEVEKIRKASAISSKTFEDLIDLMKVGIKEYELAAELIHLLNKKGSSGLAFEPIVAFGKNTAEPHYTSGSRALKKGDLIVLDFGARFNRYCADITRTLVMGKATKRQRRIYDTVLEANEMAIDKVREGAEGKALHNAVKDYIDKKGFKGRFTHGLGHGLGLVAHDGRGLNPSTDITLKRNMVFTIEPGIYFPGFGGVRIEDDVVVRKNGCTVLTKARKDLIEL